MRALEVTPSALPFPLGWVLFSGRRAIIVPRIAGDSLFEGAIFNPSRQLGGERDNLGGQVSVVFYN